MMRFSSSNREEQSMIIVKFEHRDKTENLESREGGIVEAEPCSTATTAAKDVPAMRRLVGAKRHHPSYRDPSAPPE